MVTIRHQLTSSRLQFMQGLGGLASCTLQVFQNFSNVPVLHYLQAVLFCTPNKVKVEQFAPPILLVQ
jgi:hypothetical protein